MVTCNYKWHCYAALLFNMYFLNQSATPIESVACNSKFKHTKLMVWAWHTINKRHHSCISIKLISLFCTGHLISWIWKIEHLIHQIWNCWNLLFQFSHLISFHCLGGPGFSKHTVRNVPKMEYFSNTKGLKATFCASWQGLISIHEFLS